LIFLAFGKVRTVNLLLHLGCINAGTVHEHNPKQMQRVNVGLNLLTENEFALESFGGGVWDAVY
jgi:hypothetical protein